MHPYSTDESRVHVYGWLAVLAVLLAWGGTALTSLLSWPQWLAGPPSVVGAFALVYNGFDRVAWRWRILRKLRIVGVEDISGSYSGTLVSTFTDEEGRPIERDVAFHVVQTWTRISIEMTVGSGSSSSTSVSALGSITRQGEAARLTYIYRNKVNPGLADRDMGDHDGAAELVVSRDGVLKGRYFNSRPRAGTLEARRESKSPPDAGGGRWK